MTFDEIRFALTVNGVNKDDLETLLNYSKKKGSDYKVLDKMLVDMGYGNIFSDEFFGWADGYDEDYYNDGDDYFSSEKIRHKHEWDE